MFKVLLFSVLFAALIFAEPALAQSADGTAGALAKNVTGQLSDFAKLVVGGLFLVGIGIGGLAALKFKAYNENPQQTKIGQPIVLALVAAFLIALPAFLGTSVATLFGTGAAYGDIKGENYDSIGD